ncbi:Uncharacterized protein ToN1_12670 [Aromatoleum petrolei]|nr:Uncharacterized protein ToN1_12670 [Aromatoleum petrolei]
MSPLARLPHGTDLLLVSAPSSRAVGTGAKGECGACAPQCC